MTSYSGNEIAIIGMSGRFPQSPMIDTFWQNLRNGVECISTFTEEELLNAGVDPTLITNPQYIRRRGVLSDIESFDANYFGYSPREAELIDPQQRLFLETTVEALENASYNPQTFHGLIGVFAGSSMNSYMLSNLVSNPRFFEAVGIHQASIANDKDFLTTRVSYKLNLNGPSVAVQTACSTSLVAVHMACQTLLSGECDMALAGGVSLSSPQQVGYLYQEEGIFSPDGSCRAFDAQAQGAVGGNGVGVVVLKRLEDALADGDNVLAVIKGSAINNDGTAKVGFTAPSVRGQSEVITEALAMAQVDAASISYVETHGTGTRLGDPIEIEALTQAYRLSTDQSGFCAIGSVKTNIGHLDAAAGVTGLIKTVLALMHKEIPPSLHFQAPNPNIDFDHSPFFVNNKLKEWKTETGSPRRAGVSSFGIGGTNAHVILEEAPAREASGAARDWQMIALSAKSDTALATRSADLVTHLTERDDVPLADVAYTLQIGREAHDHRLFTVVQDLPDAVNVLQTSDPKRVFSGEVGTATRPIVFMFPGTGDHYVEMALGLYQSEECFRKQVDTCADILLPLLGTDIRDILFPNGTQKKVKQEAALDFRAMLGRGTLDANGERLNRTQLLHPILFTIEYAMAQLLQEWGIRPQALIGYSLGEYIAACVAEMLPLEDALLLVTKRAQLIDQLPGGAMLAITASEYNVNRLLNERLSLAAVNSETLCVVSGEEEAIAELEARLAAEQIVCRRLQTTHAFHSHMMKASVQSFSALIGTFDLQPPVIPFISNVTGTWITQEEATDPQYWARHLTQTVRFEQGISNVWSMGEPILVEVGPGQGLTSLAAQHPASKDMVNRLLLTTMRSAYERHSDIKHLLTTVGRLWVAGIDVDWNGLYESEQRNRIPLPTYPFERQRYWLEAPKSTSNDRQEQPTGKRASTDWFYLPTWRRTLGKSFRSEALQSQNEPWVVFVDQYGLGEGIVKRLQEFGQTVTTVQSGERFTKCAEGVYTVNPTNSEDYKALFTELKEQQRMPRRIYHLFGIREDRPYDTEQEALQVAQERGFYSLVYTARAFGLLNGQEPSQLFAVTSHAHDVLGSETLYPEQALLLGAVKVIGQENPLLSCRSIDVDIEQANQELEKRWIDFLIEEGLAGSNDWEISYRGPYRWSRHYEPITLEQIGSSGTRLRDGGVYLITGGVGRIGLTLSEYLAAQHGAKIALTSRSPFPARTEWEAWLQAHGETDATSQTIRRLQQIEQAGGQVCVLQADVANLEQMEAVLRETEQRFGALHGVIHSAGYTKVNGIQPVFDLTTEVAQQHFLPKVNGVLVLERLLEGRELDFVLVNSSLSPIIGGLGFAAYASANMFMDAFVQRKRRSGETSWFSLNWEGWTYEEETDDHMVIGKSTRGLSITPEEAVAVFPRILNLEFPPQLIMSTGDLNVRLRQWINPTAGRVQEQEVRTLHPRPKLANDYVEPRTETERLVAEMWQTLLGIEKVGVHDHFFQVGGHSLLAVQLLSRIRQATGAEVTMHDLFEDPTVSAVAERIEKAKQEPAQAEVSISRTSRDRYRVQVPID